MSQPPLLAAGVDDVLAQKATRGPRTPKPVHPLEHLASKHPDGIRATWCTTCKAPILTGLDDVACAFDARTDVVPLTPLGEALARIGGQQTYEIRAGKPPRIVRRDAHAITARPAGGDARPRYDVVTTHTCTPVVPEAATTSALPAASALYVFDPTQTPPF